MTSCKVLQTQGISTAGEYCYVYGAIEDFNNPKLWHYDVQKIDYKLPPWVFVVDDTCTKAFIGDTVLIKPDRYNRLFIALTSKNRLQLPQHTPVKLTKQTNYDNKDIH